MPTITPPTCRLQTARLISDRDLQLLRRIDKKDPAYQAKLLEEVRWVWGFSMRLCTLVASVVQHSRAIIRRAAAVR